jgi:ankyrin repeat domain-containing protein 13
MGGIPELLVKLKDAPDFYVEMTWEFTSWVPLVSRQATMFTCLVFSVVDPKLFITDPDPTFQ